MTLASPFGLGWRPDLPDHRDYAALEPHVPAIPKAVDLSEFAGPVLDQGQLGSCTAHGVAGVLEWLDRKTGKPVDMVSRLYQYYNTRAMEGTIQSDSGGTIRDAVKAAATWGECPERLWPYDIQKFATEPPALCYRAASRDVALRYWRVRTTPFPGAQCMAAGFPVVFGFVVYESFMDIGADGIASMPEPGERQAGGHCVWTLGYDLGTRLVRCRNSWSSSWGDGGDFFLPIEYVANPQLASDFWTIRKTGPRPSHEQLQGA